MQAFTRPERVRSGVGFQGGSAGLLYGAQVRHPRQSIWPEDEWFEDPRFELARVSEEGWMMHVCLPHDQALSLIDAVTHYAHSYRRPSAMRSSAGGWYGSANAEDLLHGWYADLDDTRPWRNVEMARALQRNYPGGWEAELFGEGSRLAAADGSERADAPFDDLWQCAYALQIAYTNSGFTKSIYQPLLEDLLRPFGAPRFRATSSFGSDTWRLGLVDTEIVLSTMSAIGMSSEPPHFGDTAHFGQMEILKQVGGNHHELRAWLRARIAATGGTVSFRADEKRLELLHSLAHPGLLAGVEPEAVEDFRRRARLD